MNLLKDVEIFTNSAIAKAQELVKNVVVAGDLKQCIEAVDRITIMTKLNPRHAAPEVIKQGSQAQIASALERLSDKLR